jgi:Pyruvate/2-oxoacid:ferredoxin oxidoreductase delta subunit
VEPRRQQDESEESALQDLKFCEGCGNCDNEGRMLFVMNVNLATTWNVWHLI